MKCMQINFSGCGLFCSELWLLFACLQKWPKFPFGPWTIICGGQQIELAKKIMEVDVDVKCMNIKYGGCGPSFS